MTKPQAAAVRVAVPDLQDTAVPHQDPLEQGDAGADALAPRYSDLTTMASVDWDAEDLEPLRHMMSRIGVELETAVEVFFAAAPEQYNMVAKSDLLQEEQARCNLLDSIHRRIACGFYLPDPVRGLGQTHARMQDWILAQESDAQRGRVGRWVFDRALLELKLTQPKAAAVAPVAERSAVAQMTLKDRLLRLVRRDREEARHSD